MQRRGFLLAAEVRTGASGAAAATRQPARAEGTLLGLALPDKPSIAVMPFENLSGDPAQDYFADGMVEDIITGLSRIKWVFVIARNSTFICKGQPVDVKRVGRELGVRYVLEGSVRKADEGAFGSVPNSWRRKPAFTFGRTATSSRLDDIFALQDEITLSVVGAIEPSLRDAEIERVKRKRPDNLDAYDLVLRALPHVYVGMPEEAAKAGAAAPSGRWRWRPTTPAPMACSPGATSSCSSEPASRRSTASRPFATLAQQSPMVATTQPRWP